MPVPPPDGRFFGPHETSWELNTHGWSASQLATVVDGLGSNSARFTMDWWYLEPTRDKWNEGQWDRFERYYDALRERGIRPLITVSSAPPWARDPNAQSCTNEQGCEFPPGVAWEGEWQEFVAEVARRFPQAAAIEIWNEPNLQGFWKPFPDPDRYGRLVATAYPAIKAVDPNMRVLAGALAPTQTKEVDFFGRTTKMPMRQFLNQAYPRIKNNSDAISFHTVFQASSFGAETLWAKAFEDARSVRRAYNDGGKKLWLTETGLTTHGPLAFSQAEQAQGLLTQYRRAMTMRDLEGMIVHTLADRIELPYSDFNRGYGLISSFDPFVPKKAFCSFAGRVRDRPEPYGGCAPIGGAGGGTGGGAGGATRDAGCSRRLITLTAKIAASSGAERRALKRRYARVERRCVPCKRRVARLKRRVRRADGQRKEAARTKLRQVRRRCAPCRRRLHRIELNALSAPDEALADLIARHDRIRRRCNGRR